MKLNEALQILEGAGYTAEKFTAQDVVDIMYSKFDPDFGGLNGWSCNVDDNNTVFIEHKNVTIQVKPLVRKQAVKVVAHTDSEDDYPGKNWKCFDKTFIFDGSETLKDFFKGITYSIKFIGK